MSVKKALFVAVAVLSLAALLVGCDGDPDVPIVDPVCADEGDPDYDPDCDSDGPDDPDGPDVSPPVPGEPLVDPRDGRSYRTIMVGAVAWMAENLDYVTPEGSWCYDDEDSNCAKYGRLYTWDAAMAACPAGWILPSDGHWNDLLDATGDEGEFAGKRLKSAEHWDGTDDYFFSALPGGARDGGSGNFYYEGERGFWWYGLEFDSGEAYDRYMMTGSDTADEYYNGKGDGHSVRCVKEGRLPPSR